MESLSKKASLKNKATAQVHTAIDFPSHRGKMLPAGKMCWQQHQQVIFGRVLVWVSVLSETSGFLGIHMNRRRTFPDRDW